MALEHKSITFPEVDLSNDEGAPGWEQGRMQPVEGTDRYRIVHQPGQHAFWWQAIQDEWERIARQYEESPGDFHSAWHYLDNHPIYWRFQPHPSLPPTHVLWLETSYGFGSGGIDVHVARVDESGSHQDDDSLNTRTEVWLESGKWALLPENGHHAHWHDYELDCGAPTYEAAVITLARLVWKRYGNDRQFADRRPAQEPA